jgi:hypothetical protein
VKRPLKRIHEGILRLLDSVSIEDMLEDSDTPAPAFAPVSLVALQSSPRPVEGQDSLRK